MSTTVFNHPSDSKSLYCVSKSFSDGNITKHVMKKRLCEVNFTSYSATPTITKCIPSEWTSSVSSSNGVNGGSGSPGKVDVSLSMSSMAGCSFCKPMISVVGQTNDVGFPIVNVTSQGENSMTFSVLNIEPNASNTTRSGPFTCRIVLLCYESLGTQTITT